MGIIEDTYNKYKRFKERENIKDWTKKEFPIWKKMYESEDKKQEYIARILAIISIANKIYTSTRNNNGYKLRTIQLIDILLFINKPKNMGLIEQILHRQIREFL